MEGRKDDERGDSRRWLKMKRTPLMYFAPLASLLTRGYVVSGQIVDDMNLT